MEGVMVSAATGALNAVVVKLATLLGDEFKNMKDVRKDIVYLSDELKYMHAFLEKMSEEENPDKQDKIWMTDVREMSYDIEDSLDEFMICIDDDKSAKKASFMKKCTKLLDKMKAHGRVSKAIQEFKTQIKEVGDRNHRYRTGATNNKDSHEMVDFRAQAIFKDASELVGIDEQKNELINLLIEDGSSSEHQAKVVAVVGLGGLGKTTIANQVYESLKDKFDCHAFVTVSRTPHMMELLRNIFRDISRQEYYTGDMQHLIKNISDFLQDKSCLLYLSMFPEDYEIEKDRLILRWIAEGFICEEDGFTQYELGERCFNELVNRSLIQGFSIFLDVFCRVHDIILEFILSKAVEENFVTLFGVPGIRVDPHRKIRRLSLQDRNEVSDELVGSQEKIKYYHARAVSVFSGSVVILPLLKFRHVRVLDLQDYRGLQAQHLAHLGGLFALRYLNLCNTNIDELPEEIGELLHLQTLDIRGTGIKQLPSSVGRLARLVTLIHSTLNHMQLPDGFGKNMQALQRLGTIILSDQSPSFVQELCHLRNLRALEVSIDGDVSKDLASSLCTRGMACLNSLIIYSNNRLMELVLEAWNPTRPSLKLLQIWGFVVPRVPRWIGSLDNLQDLVLFVQQLGVRDFGLLGSLNALSSLCLWVKIEVADRSSSSQGTQRVKISGSHGFPSLRRFRVGSEGCAFGLLFEAGAMPKLHELSLKFDGDKTGSLTDGEFDFGIQHLPCLALVKCYSGVFSEEEPEQPAWSALKKAVSFHPNHPKLQRSRLRSSGI